jgi:hypothetical protein
VILFLLFLLVVTIAVIWSLGGFQFVELSETLFEPLVVCLNHVTDFFTCLIVARGKRVGDFFFFPHDDSTTSVLANWQHQGG